MATWVIVAHRGGARFFSYLGRGKGLERIREVQHPEGRLKSGEIDSDAPGVGRDRKGPARHPMGHEESASERVASNWARELAHALGKARVEGELDRVVLVAEPGFLGLLRGALDGPTGALVRDTVGKDLGHVRDADVARHLTEVLP
jgi:protein required for attachment to host cells